MQKGRIGRVTTMEWRTHQEHSCCDLLVQKNFCHTGSWYWKNDKPPTLKTITKVTNILKEPANTINRNKQIKAWVQEPRNRIPTNLMASQDAFENDG